MENITKDDLIIFVDEIRELWNEGVIPYPVHFCGGNEDQLIRIFNEIREGDYIFSTHRNQYHYLLAGGSKEYLKKLILEGSSMHVFDKRINFITSAIVAGTPAMAAGVALALKRKNSERRVWCFVGDGAEDEGHFYEAVRFVQGHDLPCIFIIEDNDRSVETPKKIRNGECRIDWPSCVWRYDYVPKYPHVGTGKQVIFKCSRKTLSEDMETEGDI